LRVTAERDFLLQKVHDDTSSFSTRVLNIQSELTSALASKHEESEVLRRELADAITAHSQESKLVVAMHLEIEHLKNTISELHLNIEVQRSKTEHEVNGALHKYMVVAREKEGSLRTELADIKQSYTKMASSNEQLEFDRERQKGLDKENQENVLFELDGKLQLQQKQIDALRSERKSLLATIRQLESAIQKNSSISSHEQITQRKESLSVTVKSAPNSTSNTFLEKLVGLEQLSANLLHGE